jgi:transcriptional regulator NrdR family protein
MKCPRCTCEESEIKRTYPRFKLTEDQQYPMKKRKRVCKECKQFFFTYEVPTGDYCRLAALAEELSAGKLVRTPLQSKE